MLNYMMIFLQFRIHQRRKGVKNKMKILYIGILIFATSLEASSSKVKRYAGNDLRGDWSWNNGDQVNDGQTKGSSQMAWPNKGSAGGSTKGRGDANPGPNRDGAWGSNRWNMGDSQNDGWDEKPPQGNSKGSAYPEDDANQEGDLETLLRGVPGMDFPNFATVPDTEFDCSQVSSQGYYGDVEAGCQVFHICQPGNRKDSFLCPVGTVFNQKYFVCDWWFNVNCSDTPSFYDRNNDIYKDPAPVTETAPVVTEKTLPWNAQDLDRKRPPAKSWGNTGPMGKQNVPQTDTPIRRGKANTGGSSQEVSNTWSRSDAQKEVTVSWGSSSATSVGSYGSSSSHSVIPTTKPIWYGIDGQPAKDQSNGMAKRNGLMHTTVPFGTRMRSSALNAWTSTEPTFPPKTTSREAPTTRGWHKVGDINTSSNSAATNSWLKTNDVSGNTGDSYTFPTTRGWLKDDIPETSIIPSGIDGVWEQQTTRRMEDGGQYERKPVQNGFHSKSDNFGYSSNYKQSISDQKQSWKKRQEYKNSGSPSSEWNNNSNKSRFRNWTGNNVSRQKSW